MSFRELIEMMVDVGLKVLNGAADGARVVASDLPACLKVPGHLPTSATSFVQGRRGRGVSGRHGFRLAAVAGVRDAPGFVAARATVVATLWVAGGTSPFRVVRLAPQPSSSP